jgi:hypothetical protein
MGGRMKRLQKAPGRARAGRAFPAVAGLGLAFLAVAILAGRALAQERPQDQRIPLVGTVTDESGVPLVGAWVGLSGEKWGYLTDQAGRFEIPKVTPGPVTLELQQLGYEDLEWKGEASAGIPLTLQMKGRPILLEGLHVVADRFASRRNATAARVEAFDRKELATSPHNSVMDFLRTQASIPLVECRSVWSDTCFLIRGRTVVPSIWVDEVPLVGGSDYLTSMSPYDFYLVEVVGDGRQIRLYTNQFMERAAKTGLRPFPFIL